MTETSAISTGWKRPFFTIWIGQAFSLLGSGLVQFALVWWLTQTTGSAVILTTATLVAMLPEVVLLPFIGALVDRWNRRRVMIVADSVVALASLALGILFWSGAIQVWHVFVVLFIRSVGSSFHWPAMQAATSMMVPEAQLSRISGLNMTIRGVLNIASPALGALLLSLVPLFGVIAVDVVTATLAVIPLLFIAIPQPLRIDKVDVVTPKVVWQDVKAGFRYVSAWPGLMAVILMAVGINFFFTPINTLMPLLVTNYFKGDAGWLATLEAGWGLGVVGGGLLLSAWGGFKRKIVTSLIGISGMGVGILLIAVAPANLFILAVFGMVFAGFMNPITNGPLMALIQAQVAKDMQGRIFSLINSLAMAASPLSMIISGPLTEALGVRVWYFGAGIIVLLVGIGSFFIPVIANLDNNSPYKIESALVVPTTAE